MDTPDSYSLLTVPAIDISRTVLDLPAATLGNTGGHRTVDSIGRVIPGYSHIDLTVCGLTALSNNERVVTDLSKWFLDNEHPIALAWVSCSTIYNPKGIIEHHSLADWMIVVRKNKKLLSLFKHNAPFTFRGVR